MTPFERGLRAARAGLSLKDCRMTGQDKKDWEQGFKAFVPVDEEELDMEKLNEDFFNKHLR